MKIRRVYFEGTKEETERFILSFDNLNDDFFRLRRDMDMILKRQMDLVNLINMLWVELKKKKT